MTVSENSATPQARLLGHEFSLYSGKARAYLRHKQIPFVEGVTPEDRKLIEERVGRRVIPVVMMPNGDCIQDTTEIIDYFERLYPQSSQYRRNRKKLRVVPG